jgi:hypothetical protein
MKWYATRDGLNVEFDCRHPDVANNASAELLPCGRKRNESCWRIPTKEVRDLRLAGEDPRVIVTETCDLISNLIPQKTEEK